MNLSCSDFKVCRVQDVEPLALNHGPCRGPAQLFMKAPIYYDPPEGYKYGFPKEYNPLPEEELIDTLIRDGYPEEMAKFGAEYTWFMGGYFDNESDRPGSE